MIRPLAVLATALILLTACTGDDPDDKETTLPVKPKAEIERVIRAEADAIAAATGGTLDGYRANSAPCETKGAWNLTGFAAIPLAAEKHVTTLRTLHEQWRAAGWTITENRTLPDGKRGALSGRNPTSGATVSVTSSDPPKQLALVIVSPCYQPAPGEDPAND